MAERWKLTTRLIGWESRAVIAAMQLVLNPYSPEQEEFT